jgi:phage shock protein E
MHSAKKLFARPVQAIIAVALVAAMVTLTSGCGEQKASINVGSDTVVIDVRTPAEFASGHLKGAVNIDLSNVDFAAQIAALDTAVKYVVYCRSGNRSATAVSYMEDAGITQVTDAGGLNDASDSTGLAVVKN